MIGLPADHEVLGELRRVEGSRHVLRTRVGDEDCVTRVLLTERIHSGQGPLVREVAMTGRGSLTGVSESVALTLEGYRVAAQIPGEVRFRADGGALWPRVVSAGLTVDHRVYITTTWIPGTPVHALAEADRLAARDQIALDVLEILRRLHRVRVAYGDLKPENIVYGGGRAALIDLDTLREVPNGTTAAVTRDLTPRWAAPEQRTQRATYLASDLWGWAALVAWLWPDGPPAAWAGAVAACRLADPLRRPETSAVHRTLRQPEVALLDWLGRDVVPGPEEPAADPAEAPRFEQGPAPGVAGPPPNLETERVPEAEPGGAIATERVPEAEPARGLDPAPAPAAPSARPSATTRPLRSGCLVSVWWFTVASTVVCLGFAGWGWYDGTLSARHRAEQLEHALRAYKTDPDMNDRSHRPELEALGEPHLLQMETARSRALGDLALVWAAGWQDYNRSWSPADQRLADAVLERLKGNRQPEAHLAVATTQASLCRLRPTDLTTTGACAGALAAVDAFYHAVGDDPDDHWLRVEAAWVQILVAGKLVEDAYARHLPATEATRLIEPALARCDEAYAWLDHAPVNGPELVEDCLVLAGLADDLAHYYTYASTLLAADPPPLDSSTIRRLYTSAGTGCSDASVTRRKGDWVVRGDPWCQAVGHYARGCRDASREVIARHSEEAPTRPWGTLQQALDMLPPSSICAR